MKRQINKKGKVFVGLSGGVDSSVSATLLKKAGYDVHGVFIKVWEPEWLSCTSKEDRLDAMRVSAKLGIPFHTLNLENEYKKEVVDYMINEYKIGHTPNPDVMCNKHVKFGAFYDWAMTQGADFVATGHYAQIKKLRAGSLELRASVDKEKDQTYFIWNLKTEQLPHILFPVGHLEKPEVRNLAKKFGLITATKKDSQGLCFLGKVDIKEFLSRYISKKEGNVLNEKGEVIGKHDGVYFLTLGERHGFSIIKKSSDEKPYYIVGKDVTKNTITVANKEPILKEMEKSQTFALKNVNWVTSPIGLKNLSARVRYRQPLESCAVKDIDLKKATAVVEFAAAQSAAAPGQSIVFYSGQVCLGGGVIV